MFSKFYKEDQVCQFEKSGLKSQRLELIKIITRYTGE